MSTNYVEIRLPETLNLGALHRILSKLPSKASSIRIKLHPNQWVTPAGIVGIACLVEQLRRGYGAAVTVDYDGCSNAGYWQRMGFFAVLELPPPPPPGVAQPARGRFCELHRVADNDEVDELTENLVAVANPDERSWRVYSHIVSEALNNVCHHSQAEGFCAAQFYPKKKEVQFCIGDFGCGLREALHLYRPKNDNDAVLKALEVGVTGRPVRFGQPQMRNRGVGLSAIHRLVQENGGNMTLWSGTGVFQTHMRSGRGSDLPWPGTLIAARMRRNELKREFRDIMEELQAELVARGSAERRRCRRLP